MAWTPYSPYITHEDSFKQALLFLRSALVGYERFARHLGVTVGSNCQIYTKQFGSEPWLITIGDNVTIAAGVRLLTHDGATCHITDETGQCYHKFAPIKIGNNVFIGVNAILFPGVTISDNVIVGAGAVVTKSLENGVYAGNPAKQICSFVDYAAKVRQECVPDSALAGCKNYRSRVEQAIQHMAASKQ